jgi:hypothetical protein
MLPYFTGYRNSGRATDFEDDLQDLQREVLGGTR